MNMYTRELMNQAHDMWSRGHVIPYDLAVKLEEAGIDYGYYEEKYLDK